MYKNIFPFIFLYVTDHRPRYARLEFTNNCLEKENISNYISDSFIDYQQEIFLSLSRKVSCFTLLLSLEAWEIQQH